MGLLQDPQAVRTHIWLTRHNVDKVCAETGIPREELERTLDYHENQNEFFVRVPIID